MTEDPLMCLFLISLDSKPAGNLFDCLNGLINFRQLDKTFIGINNLMASRFKKASNQFAVFYTNRHLSFIPIMPRTFHSEDRMNDDIFKFADPRQHLTDLIFLIF